MTPFIKQKKVGTPAVCPSRRDPMPPIGALDFDGIVPRHEFFDFGCCVIRMRRIEEIATFDPQSGIDRHLRTFI
ncbi:MAG: hypothetical protein WCY11_17810, partial [Novosphingobium sp.]